MKFNDRQCYGCGHPESWVADYFCDRCKQRPYDPSRPIPIREATR